MRIAPVMRTAPVTRTFVTRIAPVMRTLKKPRFEEKVSGRLA